MPAILANAMSQENVELVRRIYEATGAGHAEEVLALYDEEVEYDFSRSPFQAILNRPAYRGHDAIRGFFHERYEYWQQAEDRCQELIEANDEVISVVTSRGRGRESGIEVEMTHFGVWSLREGKVIRVRWFGTLDEALAAAGLSE